MANEQWRTSNGDRCVMTVYGPEAMVTVDADSTSSSRSVPVTLLFSIYFVLLNLCHMTFRSLDILVMNVENFNIPSVHSNTVES
jgi:hypothetical protein